jgi:hypothetical protein
MSQYGIYTRWDITDRGDGKALLRYETNDDNDDGFIDPGPVAVWEKEMDMQKALSMAGKTRHGSYGQPVYVFLDLKKI